MSYISILKKPSCFASHWLVKKRAQTQGTQSSKDSHIYTKYKSLKTH